MKKLIAIICLILAIAFMGGIYINKAEEDRYLVINGQTIEGNNDIEYVQAEGEMIDDEKEEQEEDLIEYINVPVEEVRIPILMYHSICNDDPNNSLMIPTEMFAEQMEWLRENDFTAMSMDDVIEAMNTGKVPKRPVLITFDDGYADNYINAFPELKNNNLKGTFFIISDTITEEGGYYMSTSMLKEMKEAGMEIENHTANHLELNNLSREDAIDSIKRGQEFLRSVIGSNGNYLCYPVGRYSDETIEIQKELGIKAALTTQGGISSIADGKYELKRIRISPMNIENFAGIFSEYMY